MKSKNVLGNALLQADDLERGKMSTENLATIQRLVEAHQRRVLRLRWTNIGAWFAVLIVFATLLAVQDSQWQGFYNLLALDRMGFVIMVGLVYAALVSWYMLNLAIKNPPSEGGMRIADIEMRMERIEALLERVVSRGNTAAPAKESDSQKQD